MLIVFFLNCINMTFLTQAVSFVLVVVLCIQHCDAQSVPDRCRCPTPSTKAFRWKNIEEFSVTAPRSRCKAEIILTLKTVNAKTKEKEQRCLSPDIYQGKHLQECWNRVNKDGRKTIKISECEHSRNTTSHIQNTTTVSQH